MERQAWLEGPGFRFPDTFPLPQLLSPQARRRPGVVTSTSLKRFLFQQRPRQLSGGRVQCSLKAQSYRDFL